MSKRHIFFLFPLVMSAILILAIPIGRRAFVTAQGITPPLPVVAIHVSELTQALETTPAGPNTPRPPGDAGTSGFEWWYTSWHYFVMPESLKEALRADGTPHLIVTDADISAGNLLHSDGSPKYPIVISLAAEAIREDEIAPLRAYVNAGGFLFVGSSSFTRNPDGTTRGNFALSAELGLRMRNPGLQNWYLNSVFAKVGNHRIVAQIPTGALEWRLPLAAEQIPWGITPNHDPHKDHYAWAVDTVGAEVLANGSAGPLVATKTYGAGRFVYNGIMQPLIGLGGYDSGMYSYLIFRQAIEWAFEAGNVPLVKLSPWRYTYDSAFIVRHDFENTPSLIQSIESIAQSEQAKGIQGEYYFTTGTVRPSSEDQQLTELQKQSTIQSLRRAVSQYGAIINSHNGGLPNPVNPALPPNHYEYWHWGPDEALDTNPPGYANGKAYAQTSISQSYQDIENWFAGLDNGRAGCGSAGNCPRIWVAPFFNSGRDDSFDMLEQLGVITLGEQKLSPFPHWTLSTKTNGKRFTHISLPVSDWYVGNGIAQSLDYHSQESIRAGVDFYHNLGFLVNFYSHGDSATYASYVITKPRIWSSTSVKIYDWWLLRSPVAVNPTYSKNGNTSIVTAAIANATDPETAIEVVIPQWSSGSVGNLQVLLNGATANPNDFRATSYGIKVKVGNTVSTVEVRYEPGIIPPTATATPTGASPLQIGETNILSTDDSGNANFLIAQPAVLPQNATIQSLSFYVSSVSGQLRLGIYDDAGGRPGALRAQTSAFTPIVGWNTQNVTTAVLLPAGTYWLTYLAQSNSLRFRVQSTGTARGYSYPFSALPNTFSNSPLSDTAQWSLYASFLTNSGQTATPTSTPVPPTATPIPTNTPIPPTTTATPMPTATPTGASLLRIGETNILGTDDSGNGNLLIAQQAILPQNATVQSLSFYVASAGGQLRLGIYDDAGGRPGTLRAQTAAFTPIVGWNTQNVITSVALPAGTYWLAYLAQSNNLHFRVGSSGSAWGYGYAFSAMPTTFSSSADTAAVHWSLYASLLSGTTLSAAAADNGGNQESTPDALVLDQHVYLPLISSAPLSSQTTSQ